MVTGFVMHVVMVLVMVSPNVSCSVVLGERKGWKWCLCVWGGCLAPCQIEGCLISFAHLIFPALVDFSFPSHKRAADSVLGWFEFECGDKVSKQSNQEMNLTLCREKVDLVMRSERGSHDSYFQAFLVQWKSSQRILNRFMLKTRASVPKSKQSKQYALVDQSSGHWRGWDMLCWRKRADIRNNSGSFISLLLLCSPSSQNSVA